MPNAGLAGEGARRLHARRPQHARQGVRDLGRGGRNAARRTVRCWRAVRHARGRPGRRRLRRRRGLPRPALGRSSSSPLPRPATPTAPKAPPTLPAELPPRATAPDAACRRIRRERARTCRRIGHARALRPRRSRSRRRSSGSPTRTPRRRSSPGRSGAQVGDPPRPRGCASRTATACQPSSATVPPAGHRMPARPGRGPRPPCSPSGDHAQVAVGPPAQLAHDGVHEPLLVAHLPVGDGVDQAALALEQLGHRLVDRVRR
jgi:hypothetical protein